MTSMSIIENNVKDDILLRIDPQRELEVKSITDKFLLTDEIIKRIDVTFKDEMHSGLKKIPICPSSLQMANTFIPKRLSGKEKGEFLALDLGGTNFRVILLKMEPSSELDCTVKYYTVSEELRLGKGEMLFEFLADCIFDFVEENHLLNRKVPLGFCFSFPMEQTGIDQGILVTWTKSFKCKNVVGEEVVQMLKNALSRRKDVAVDVVAVINDATGTLMMGSYLDKRTAIGLILGTGCNAAYLEKVCRIEKWEGEHPGVEEVIIDIEWGAFGDNGSLDFIRTDFDIAVNSESLIIDSFTFEKLFAGKYIGQIVKKILLKLCNERILFIVDQCVQEEDWTFSAEDVSKTMEETDLQQIILSIENKGFKGLSLEDAAIVKYVCTIVSIRGALLVSICLAHLLTIMDRDDVTIAVDGSLFKLHPKYKEYMEKFITALAPQKKFQLILAEDGSGKGAGLVAAVVTSLDRSALHA